MGAALRTAGIAATAVTAVWLAVPATAAAAVDCSTAGDPVTCAAVTDLTTATEAVGSKLDAVTQVNGTTKGVRISGIDLPVGFGELRSRSELPVADGTLREAYDQDAEIGAAATTQRVRLSGYDRELVISGANSLHGDAWVLIGAVVGAAFLPMLLRELLSWKRGS